MAISVRLRRTNICRRASPRRSVARSRKDASAPGDKLPTEHFLAKTFGVSRSVVREAIAQLRNEGLVETRQGVGAFVTERQARQSIRIEQGALSRKRQFSRVFSSCGCRLKSRPPAWRPSITVPSDLAKLDESLAP